MSAVTSPLGFVYPVGTDAVINGPAAIQALAEAVDDYLYQSAAACSYYTGWANPGGGFVSFVVRAGNIAILNLQAQVISTTTPGNSYILAVPAGYLPRGYYATGFGVKTGGSGVGTTCGLQLNSSGQLSVFGAGAGFLEASASWAGSVVYVV